MTGYIVSKTDNDYTTFLNIKEEKTLAMKNFNWKPAKASVFLTISEVVPVVDKINSLKSYDKTAIKIIELLPYDFNLIQATKQHTILEQERSEE